MTRSTWHRLTTSLHLDRFSCHQFLRIVRPYRFAWRVPSSSVIAFTLAMTCLPLPANGESQLSVFGYNQVHAAARARLFQKQLNLPQLPKLVVGMKELDYWSTDSTSDVLWGVSSPMFQAFHYQHKLSTTRLGVMYPRDGKNLLVLVPRRYRILFPVMYAVSKSTVAESPIEILHRVNPGIDDLPLQLGEILGAYSAFPESKHLWPEKTLVVRYPSRSDGDDDDDDDDDDDGCEDEHSFIMICDPDALERLGHFLYESGMTKQPSFDFITNELGYEVAALTDDNRPECYRPLWFKIPTEDDAYAMLPKILGYPDEYQTYRQKSKISGIYSRMNDFPFHSWIVYAMKCSPQWKLR